jgi:hypothetical protein
MFPNDNEAEEEQARRHPELYRIVSKSGTFVLGLRDSSASRIPSRTMAMPIGSKHIIPIQNSTSKKFIVALALPRS